MSAPATPGEFYQLRRYHLQTGPQTGLTERYFKDALIPALGRMEMGPVGAFRTDIGPETPSYHLLIPSTDLTKLVSLDLLLAQDPVFLKAAEPFWNAPAITPAYIRVESTLLSAFPSFPKLTLPPPPSAGADKSKHIFQLRTYESPSDRDHAVKVGMVGDGELDIFHKVGFNPVFFGNAMVGGKLPHLTYMLSFETMAELEAKWSEFSNDPGWKKMKASQKYGFEDIVTNIANLILKPLAMSQI